MGQHDPSGGTSPLVHLRPLSLQSLTIPRRRRQWFVSVHTSASAVADLLITWVLIYTLRQNQKRGMQRYVSPLLRPFPSRFLWCVGAMCVLIWAVGGRTNDMINDLILYSVSTGARRSWCLFEVLS